MVLTYFIFGTLAFIVGCGLFLGAVSAPQETVAALVVLIGAVFIVGASIIGVINDTMKALIAKQDKPKE